MMSDQSVEINGINGWYEVMMDKQNRYSHVRVLENNDARVVLHWRYALCDRFYNIARPDEITEWGDWVDESTLRYIRMPSQFVTGYIGQALLEKCIYSSRKRYLRASRGKVPKTSW
ncbi:MAG: hypothetical protein ACYSUJ_14165, partial [Planctomycetota bacterium]